MRLTEERRPVPYKPGGLGSESLPRGYDLMSAG